MAFTERQAKIVKTLHSTPSAMDTTALQSAAGQVSRETIRKDLKELERQGLVTLSYGKVALNRDALSVEAKMSIGLLSKTERQEEILRLLKAEKTLRIATLTHLFGVSENTIRADVGELLPEISWEYGKISYTPPQRNDEIRFLEPDFRFPPSIARRAERAAHSIRRGEILFLDESECSLCLASMIPETATNLVFTTSVKTVLALARRCPGIAPRFLPGPVDPATLVVAAESGPTPNRIDVAFIEAGGYVDGEFYAASTVSRNNFEAIAPAVQRFMVFLNSESAGSATSFGSLPNLARLSVAEVLVDDLLEAKRAEEVFGPQFGFALVVTGERCRIVNIARSGFSIGVSVLDEEHEFSQRFVENLERSAAILPDARFVIANNHRDEATTMRNVDLFMEMKVDLVIEYQHESSLGPTIAEKLARQGIPLLAVDLAIPGAHYFGVNNYLAGVLCGRESAEYIQAAWGGHLDRLIFLSDEAAGEASMGRRIGTADALRERIPLQHGQIRVLECKNDALDAERTLTRKLAFAPGLRTLIVCTNCNLAAGAIRSLRAQGATNTRVAAHNNSEILLEELNDPESPLIGVVDYHPEQYGDRILSIVREFQEQGEVPHATFVNHDWVPSKRSRER